MGDGISLSQCREDGILAACASPDEVLIARCGVVKHGGHGNIGVGALTGLIVCAEAPGIAFTLAGDGEAVIGAGGDHSTGSDAGNLSGTDEDASFIFGVADKVVVGNGGGIESGLTAVEAAPDEALAAFGRCKGVVGATREVGDGIAVEFKAINNRWGDDYGVVFAGVAVDAGSTEGVGAP